MEQRNSPPQAGHSWLLSIAGRLCGPVDDAELRRLAEAGQLSRFSLVQRVGAPEWRPISAAAELAENLPDLPVQLPIVARLIRLAPAELVATLAVLLLIGGFWACLAGLFSSPERPFRQPSGPTAVPAPAAPSPDLAAQTTAALGEGRWETGLKAGRQYLAAVDGSLPAIQEQKRAWTALILEHLAPAQNRSFQQTLPLLKTCLEWDETSRPRVAERGLVFARDSVSTASFNLPAAEAYFDFALGLGQEETPTSVTQIAWAALKTRLTDLPALGQEGFGRLFSRCALDDLPESVTEHPSWLLAQALALEKHGDWEQARTLLRQVADSPVAPDLARVAQRVLAPPQPGRREYARPPVIFRTPAKRPSLRVELLAAEVTTNSVVMELRLTNAGVRRQTMAFPVVMNNTGRSYDPLHLIDDHGQAVAAPWGFGEVGQQPLSSRDNLQVIELARGEERQLLARFPLISPGATEVRFVSPRLPNQPEWGWKEISLKAGPFDPPIATLPLRLADLPALKAMPILPESRANAASANTGLAQQPDGAEAGQSAPTTAQTLEGTRPDQSATAPPMAGKNAPSQTARNARAAAQKKAQDAEQQAQRQAELAAQFQAEKEARVQADKEARAQKAAEQQRALQASRQASAARQETQRERTRAQGRAGRNALKLGLFAAAETQRTFAEDAYQKGDYTKAEIYFQAAVKIYQNIK